MKGNRVLVGVTLWLVAVASVAGLAWFAIDSAGRSVTALPISPSGVSEQLDPDPAVTDLPTSPVGTVSTTGPSLPTGSPTTLPTGVSTGVSTSRPPTSPPRTSVPSTTTRPPPRTSSPPPPPRLRRTTRSDYWGSVTIGCFGAKVSLQSATPANDWAIKQPVQNTGPVKVDVEFLGDHGAKAGVLGDCVGGKPRIRVTTSGGEP